MWVTKFNPTPKPLSGMLESAFSSDKVEAFN